MRETTRLAREEWQGLLRAWWRERNIHLGTFADAYLDGDSQSITVGYDSANSSISDSDRTYPQYELGMLDRVRLEGKTEVGRSILRTHGLWFTIKSATQSKWYLESVPMKEQKLPAKTLATSVWMLKDAQAEKDFYVTAVCKFPNDFRIDDYPKVS